MRTHGAHIRRRGVVERSPWRRALCLLAGLPTGARPAARVAWVAMGYAMKGLGFRTPVFVRIGRCCRIAVFCMISLSFLMLPAKTAGGIATFKDRGSNRALRAENQKRFFPLRSNLRPGPRRCADRIEIARQGKYIIYNIYCRGSRFARAYCENAPRRNAGRDA